VQVATVADAAAAENLSRRLAAAGYEVYMVPDAEGMLRVRVGPYPTRAAAQNAVARLRKAGRKPLLVQERQPIARTEIAMGR
jgi:cell division septation protein DedD